MISTTISASNGPAIPVNCGPVCRLNADVRSFTSSVGLINSSCTRSKKTAGFLPRIDVGKPLRLPGKCRTDMPEGFDDG